MLIVTYSVPVAANASARKAISDALEANDAWWHYIAPTWLVVTEKSANDVAKSIIPYVKELNGRLLVMEVKPDERQGLLPEKAWEWISTRAKRLGRQTD